MRWNDNNLDKPKVFDSKDLSEDTQKIMLDKIQERLKEEEDYTEEFKAYEEYKISEKKKKKKRKKKKDFNNSNSNNFSSDFSSKFFYS